MDQSVAGSGNTFFLFIALDQPYSILASFFSRPVVSMVFTTAFPVYCFLGFKKALLFPFFYYLYFAGLGAFLQFRWPPFWNYRAFFRQGLEGDEF